MTKPKHPWTNGQVERMNRTIKEATVQRFYYESHQQLRRHLADFVAAYNYGRPAQDAEGPHPLRIHLQKPGLLNPERLHYQSAPANAGTKHLRRVSFVKTWGRYSAGYQTPSTPQLIPNTHLPSGRI